MSELNLCFISDTHGQHNEVVVPKCDVLIHSGDCTDDLGQGSLRRFAEWFEDQPAKHKILIAGNHDGAFEKWPEKARTLLMERAPSVIYLQEESVILDGFKFYGFPQQPEFCNWHFNVPRDKMHIHTDKIPDDTDVIISHGPPFSILDISGFDNSKVGCRALYEAMMRVKPTVHCFGHIHHSYGTHRYFHDDGWLTTCINASICNEKYRPVNKPIQLRILK